MSSTGKRSFVSIIVGFLILATVLKNLKVARALAVGVVAALVIAGMAGSAGAAVSGLVAEWHFDGNAQDSSGNGNNGTINGATFVQGISGQALGFDGVDDMVVVPHSPSLSLDKYTLEAWVKRNQNRELVATEAIIVKRYEQSWMDNYGLYIYPNGKVAASSYSPDIWTWFDLTSAKNISAGDWYHIAATYDRTTLKIYINGVLDNSVNKQYSPYQNNYQLVIGRACWGDPCLFKPSNPSFNGIIDEVRIYNRALSASEIHAEYNALTYTPIPTTVPPTTVPPTTVSPTTVIPTTVPPTTVPPTITTPLPPTCEEPKGKFEIALKNFREAEDRLKVAEEQYRSEKEAIPRNEERQAKKEKLWRKFREVVKEFLNRRIDLLSADIELLKCDTKFTGISDTPSFDASSTLDKHRMELESIRIKLQQATEKQDLFKIDRDLRDIKEKLELEKRYYKGIGVNNNMDIFLANTDDASVRMNEIIKKLNEQGKDTSKLTGIASDFNNLMNEAKESHQKTLDIFREHSGFDSSGMVTDIRKAQDFVRQIKEQQKDTRRLKSAIAKLKEFFGETKKLIKDTQESTTGTGGVKT